MSSFSRKKLLLEGGGDMPYQGAVVFHRWVLATGGTDLTSVATVSSIELPKVLVITWASERSPEDLTAEFIRWGNDIFSGDQLLVSPSIVSMENCEESRVRFQQQLSMCSGVFFCGGDQNYITKLFGVVDGLKVSLILTYENGIPFAGTSAGAAIMSHTMITGEGDFEVIDKDKVETAIGLGLVKIAVIDQHFIKRKRLNRLLSVLSGSPEIYGIGVDEDMSVAIIDDTNCEVLGPEGRNVVLIEKSASEAGTLNMKILSNGRSFILARSHLQQ